MNDVVIGWVHPGTVTAAFMDSVLRTIAFDRGNGNRLLGWNGVQCSANISSGRNELVKWFLASPAQWLMCIDTDMIWSPDAVHALLAVASEDRPIVGGLCFGMEPDTGQIFPTLYDITGEAGSVEFIRYEEYPENTLMPVMGTGAAFLLLHRKALERVRDEKFSDAYPWFQERELDGKRIGEDLAFCMRAGSLGIPVHVHTGVQIGHLKTHPIGAPMFQAQRAAGTAKED